MKNIKDIILSQKPTFSFEVFPPKTEKGLKNLTQALEGLSALNFDFASVTYGAGGSSREKTFEIVSQIQKNYDLPVVHHFTCVLHSKKETHAILNKLKAKGISNILALRGDAPLDQPHWRPGPDNFGHSAELVSFIREEYGDFFTIGVAGFPQGHPLAQSLDFDAQVLKEKVDAGADFVVTQFFFENQEYFDYVERLQKLGVDVPVVPGIVPVTHYENLIRFAEGCAAKIPQKIHDIFRPLMGDEEATLKAGTGFAIQQCQDLLDRGAPGIHFYALNKVEPVKTILEAIKGC